MRAATIQHDTHSDCEAWYLFEISNTSSRSHLPNCYCYDGLLGILLICAGRLVPTYWYSFSAASGYTLCVPYICYYLTPSQFGAFY